MNLKSHYDWQLGGYNTCYCLHLKKLRRAEEGAKIFGVFRLKNHDFTPKNYIFSNCGGRREHFLGISCEKSRFYAKKWYFSNFRGGARRVRLPLDPPLQLSVLFICNAGFAETKFDTYSIHITQAQMSF